MRDPFVLFRSNWMVFVLVCLAVILFHRRVEPLTVVARSVETSAPQSKSVGVFEAYVDACELAKPDAMRQDAWVDYTMTVLTSVPNGSANGVSPDLNGKWSLAKATSSTAPVLNTFRQGVARSRDAALVLETVQSSGQN